MQFIRTFFWVVVTVLLAVFTVQNWATPVDVLMGGVIWGTKLPVPILLGFLLGFLPLYIWHRFFAWRYRRRVATLETPRVVPGATVAYGVGEPAAATPPAPPAPPPPPPLVTPTITP